MKKATEMIRDNIPKDIFTDADLMNIFSGTPDQRYGLMKRAVASEEIIHIRRGLYGLAPKYARHKVSLYELAQHIYGPSYVSLESALSYHGWIPEAVYSVTSASMKKSQDFDTPLGRFCFKRIPSDIFYEGVDRVEGSGGGFFMASPFKALVDYIYIRKKDWADLTPLVESLRIDEDYFEEISEQEIDILKQNYHSRRVQRFLDGMKKELGYER
ncbi:MAG: hypothetical protein KAJ18_01765 [Candidatus Omnitrophica bacterium]|nr:hypothetical protein [Candidatus Omnitrophota bacterium]